MDAAGWRVFAGVRSERDASALDAESSERLLPVILDITSPEQIGAAVERVSSEVGGEGIHGLVNNAGITIPCPLEAMPLEDFHRLIAVNLTGQFAITQAVLPQLRPARGRIVFVSSVSSRRAIPMLAAYTASKAGLNAVADGFRQELRPWRIGVSIVEPGAIETPIWDRGEREFETAMENSPIEAENMYGNLIAAFRVLVDRSRKRRIPPERVVSSIFHALTAGNPRVRYLIGLDAKSQALATRFIPDRLLDFGTAKYINA
jgi:NAD(P)-dependent dehydrogenase (short-subunit alcohol dehydrogenase family)